MKTLLSAIILFMVQSSSAQSTTVEVKLFLPVHVKNSLTPNDKLHVHLVALPGDTVFTGRKTVVARKIQQNIYQFELPKTKLWNIAFTIGHYSYQMMCVDNKEGKAQENYPFNILLDAGVYDPAVQFLPPCVRSDYR